MTPLQTGGWDIFSAISTGFAAIFTALGVIIALAVAWREYRVQQRRVADAARVAERAQADLIAAWLNSPEPEEPELALIGGLSNASPVPIYNVVVAVVGIQGGIPDGAMRVTVVSALPPGRWWIPIRGVALDSSMNKRYGVEIAFTDTAGRRWQRTTDGRLEQLSVEPPAVYDLNPPFGYATLLTEPPKQP